MTVHLIADSAADLPRSYFEENGIGFIPLRFLSATKNMKMQSRFIRNKYLKRCKMGSAKDVPSLTANN